MSEQPESSPRVRFAIAQGYTVSSAGGLMWIHGRPAPRFDLTDANTVREALMGMTEEEWTKFKYKVLNILGEDDKYIGGFFPSDVIEAVLKLDPPTLAEIYCEVRNV